MSSSSDSVEPTPTTPVKETTMTVNKENIAPRTPPLNALINDANKTTSLKDANTTRNPGEVVQVPSTVPPMTVFARKPDDVQESDQAENEGSNNAEEGSSESNTVGLEDATTDLPAFDWEDLQRRYTKAIQAVNKEEDEILEEFFKFSEAFSIWGQISANRDNERAAKRLKTRESFVRLRESSLKDKKEHYTQVVDAFKSALALLHNT